MGWSTKVAIYFVSSLTLDVFGQHKLRYILSHSWHRRGLVNTTFDTYSYIDDMGWVWSTHTEMLFVSSLAWEGFGTHVEMLFVSSLLWAGFRHSRLSYMCPRWHRMGLVNASWYKFCLVAVMRGVWSTQVEMHFMSSLKWDVHVEMHLVASLAWYGFLSTQVETHFVSSLSFD